MKIPYCARQTGYFILGGKEQNCPNPIPEIHTTFEEILRPEYSQRRDGMLHVCQEAEGAGGGGDEEAGEAAGLEKDFPSLERKKQFRIPHYSFLRFTPQLTISRFPTLRGAWGAGGMQERARGRSRRSRRRRRR